MKAIRCRVRLFPSRDGDTYATGPLSKRAPSLVGSVIDSSTALLASQKHDIVRFAMGAPSDDVVPTELFDLYYGQAEPDKYSYGETQGEPELIERSHLTGVARP